VRDLASGFQLAWQSIRDTTAASTRRVLRWLFSEHGKPLILKCDNGSAFSAWTLREFLAADGVRPLYSPPYWPRYNGACEAGIGRLKERTAWQAACASLDGTWTGQNVRKALAITNDLIRSWSNPPRTRREVWEERLPLEVPLRAAFTRDLATARQVACTELGCPSEQLLDRSTQARVDRLAIPRVLRQQGLLHVTGRLVTPPVSLLKTAKIW
jgi:transposase InsO family protein